MQVSYVTLKYLVAIFIKEADKIILIILFSQYIQNMIILTGKQYKNY